MTSELIDRIFARHFDNPVLRRMEDSGIVEGASRIAVTTDSFVVKPLFFRGGDIGRLSVCGTVNDLCVSGAIPRYLTCGFILEEGLPLETLERAVSSLAATAAEAGVIIVAGDTKVIEGDGGLLINTTGVGFIPEGYPPVGADQIEGGEAVIVSGTLGDHHAAILSARMEIVNTIQSDCAPLNAMVAELFAAGIRIKAMRDVTRGGLATVLRELATVSGTEIRIRETLLPVSPQVRGFCNILGLDPLYMGNEGKIILLVDPEDREKALHILKANMFGSAAAYIGDVGPRLGAVGAGAPADAAALPPAGEGEGARAGTGEDAPAGGAGRNGKGKLILETTTGGTRILPELIGEGLPRIC